MLTVLIWIRPMSSFCGLINVLFAHFLNVWTPGRLQLLKQKLMGIQ